MVPPYIERRPGIGAIMERPIALEHLLKLGSVDVPADVDLEVTGADPVYDTSFRVGEAAAVALAAQGAAVAALWKLRTGRGQRVHVDVAEAAHSLLSVL